MPGLRIHRTCGETSQDRFCPEETQVGHLSVCITSLREAVDDPIPRGFVDTGEDVEF